MTRAERIVVKIWLWVTAGAAIAFFLPGLLILLTFLLVTIPLVMLLHEAPTAWLYFTAALLFYGLFRLMLHRRRVPRLLLAAAAAAIAAAAGFLVPQYANREIEARAAAIMAGDHGTEPLLGPVESIGLFVDRGLGSDEGRCWDDCQRLLFSGLAKTVVQGDHEAARNPSLTAEPVLRHRIVPMVEGCDNSMLMAAFADRSEWGGAPPPPYLWEKLDDLAAQGLCFRSDRSHDARADVSLIMDYGYKGPVEKPLADLRLVPLDAPERRTILAQRGGRTVELMRRTQLEVKTLAVPLQLVPPFDFTVFNPGHWKLADSERRGVEPTHGMMKQWIRDDVTIRGLGTNRPEAIVVTGRPAKSGTGREQP